MSASVVVLVPSDGDRQDSHDGRNTDKAGDTDLFDRQVAATAPTESGAAVAPMSASVVVLVPSDGGHQDSHDGRNTDKAGDTDLFHRQVAATAPTEGGAAVARMLADGEPRGGQGTSDTDKSDEDRLLPPTSTVRGARSQSSSAQSSSDQISRGQSGSGTSGSGASGSAQSSSDQSSGDQSSSSAHSDSSAEISSDQSDNVPKGNGKEGSAQSSSDQSSGDQSSSSAHSDSSADINSDHSGKGKGGKGKGGENKGGADKGGG
jgi:hypothetical protein